MMTKVKYKIFSSALFSTSLKVLTFWEKQSCKEKKPNIVRHLVVHLFSRIFRKYFSRPRPYLRLRYLSLLYSLFFFTLQRTQELDFQWHCHRSSTHYFSLFFCVQRIQRILETQTKYNLKYTSIDNAMLRDFFLLSKESKNLSNRNKKKDLKYTFSYNIYASPSFSSLQRIQGAM